VPSFDDHGRARELHLDWHTVKELEKQYMREQLRRQGAPRPKVIGIDEVSIKKGHTYRIVVSDLERRRPIWFGGKDRTEASMDEFYKGLGPSVSKRIRLAVMDMWKPFRTSTLKPEHAPQSHILFDKFHVIRHLGDALDQVRKSEYKRLYGQGPALHQGSEVHAALAAGEPHAAGTSVLEAPAQGQQTAQHGLHAQGVLCPALGLTRPRAGHVASSRTGATRSSGSASSRTRNSPST